MPPQEINSASAAQETSGLRAAASNAARAGVPPPFISSLVRAGCFSAFLYVGWMLLAGLFHPSLEWFAGSTGLPVAILLYYFSLDGFALGLSAGFLRGIDGMSFRALGLWFFPRWWAHAAAGTAAGAATITLVALLASAWSGAGFFHPAANASRALGLLAFFLLAAAFEELMFRGYAWQRTTDALGPISATLISSLLFGLAHAGNPRATWLSTVNTVLAGVLMCVARARSRALWMPIGLHFGWNVFLGPVLGYPVSGLPLSGGDLSVSAGAAAWATGGAYGLEGSLLLTAVVAAAILLLALGPFKWLFPRTIQE